jgi:hypothetical protein
VEAKLWNVVVSYKRIYREGNERKRNKQRMNRRKEEEAEKFKHEFKVREKEKNRPSDVQYRPRKSLQ